MHTSELEQYLHQHIPLSKAMAVSVLNADPHSVLLSAPLQPNINHRDTVFGGSASALAILAAWALVHLRLRAENIEARLVIQRNSMHYERPIAGAFMARASEQDIEDWPRFLRLLSRKGMGRVTVHSALEYEDRIAGRFSGEFVALDAPRHGNARG